MQEVCISDPGALAKLLPMEPCLDPGCNCQLDSDCPGENGRYERLTQNYKQHFKNILE